MDIEKIINLKYFEILATVIGVVLFFILREISNRIIIRQVRKHDLEISRSLYTRKFFNFSWFMMLLLAMGFVWDVSFKGIFASFFAVAGVALFANWSILSNLTASVILFFNFPFKIGSRVKILDKDDSVEGVVIDITFFSIQIQDNDGNMISFPNNIAIQKAIMQLSE